MLNQNFFTNVPTEFVIPKKTKIIIVSDYFMSDVLGGAELTLDAILKKCPTKSTFNLHSSSLTEEMLLKNKDKYWVFGNYAMINHNILNIFVQQNLKYSVIEFDFKFCKFRSLNLHFLNSGRCCDCINTDYGKMIESFYLGAERIFWMSEKQKNIFLDNVPSLKNKIHIVQGSCFVDEVFDFIKQIKKPENSKKNKTAVLGNGSWIKGVAQTVALLKHKKIPFDQIPNLEYLKFLNELSNYKSLTFKPLCYDTAPRLIIEAKLLGCELNLNNNVLIKDDDWFNQPTDEIEKFLKTKPVEFWSYFKTLF